jgi:phosphatidylserine decarboxylase precursor
MIRDVFGNEIEEPSPSWVKWGIHAQKIFGLSKISKKATKSCEEKKKDKNVKSFAKKYNIDYRDVSKCSKVNNENDCWEMFDSQNDFFIRRRIGLPPPSVNFIADLNPKKVEEYLSDEKSSDEILVDYYTYMYYTRMYLPWMPLTQENIDNMDINIENEMYFKDKLFASPADSYSIYLNDSDIGNKLWIKGEHFDVNQVFKTNISSLKNYQLLIFRLAPHHYHRYHCPISGKIMSIEFMGEEYFSVNPIIVRSKVDVYTKNVRVVITVKTNEGDLVHIAIIGATCVGSIEITNPTILKVLGVKSLTDGDIKAKPIHFSEANAPSVNIFDELGIFQFGGSTLLTLIPKRFRPNITGQIIINNTYNKKGPIETEISVGNILFT